MKAGWRQVKVMLLMYFWNKLPEECKGNNWSCCQ